MQLIVIEISDNSYELLPFWSSSRRQKKKKNGSQFMTLNPHRINVSQVNYTYTHNHYHHQNHRSHQ